MPPSRRRRTISREHLDFLAKQGISRDVAEAAGIYSVLERDDIPTEFRKWPGRDAVPGLIFPWRGYEGDGLLQLRPDRPVRKSDGTLAKYMFPKHSKLVLNVHPMMDALVDDTKIPKIFVEGTKQPLAVISSLVSGADYAVIGMAGCWGFKQDHKEITDFKALGGVLPGSMAYLGLDADWQHNPLVWDAAKEVTGHLKALGAVDVHYILVPGGGTDGLDDYLADQLDPGAVMRNLIATAEKTLGRRPAKSRASTYFDNTKSLLADTAAKQLIDTDPCALAMDGSIAIYQEGRYRIDTTRAEMIAAVHAMLGEDYRPAHRDTISDVVIAHLVDNDWVLTDRPQSPWLNVANGMLDLKTLELHPHDPDLFSTQQIPVAWDPDATCPVYDRWLEGRCGAMGKYGDQREVLHQTFAQMLDPMITPSKSPFVDGPSRSGKSTELRIMQALVGADNCSAIPLHSFADRFAVAGLYGKMLNSVADLSSEDVRDLSVFKMVTGEDAISAERKFKDPFTFTNRALLAYSANEPPAVSESSRAYLARMVPIKFPATFEGSEDPKIERWIINRELPGILVRLVHALQRSRATSTRAHPDPLVQEEFELASDRVAQWMHEEKTILTPEMMAADTEKGHRGSKVARGTSGHDLYEEFNDWAKTNGGKGMSYTRFKARLTRHRGVIDVRFGRSRTRGYNIIPKLDDDQLPGNPGRIIPILTMASERSEEAEEAQERAHGDSRAEVARVAREPEEPAGEPEDVPSLPVVEADVDTLHIWIYDVIRANPLQATEGKIREALGISSTEFHSARDHLIKLGVVARRRGKGFDHLAQLVHVPGVYTTPSAEDMIFRTGPQGTDLFRGIPAPPCIDCGSTDGTDPRDPLPQCIACEQPYLLAELPAADDDEDPGDYDPKDFDD